jgi:hypothetical protein
MYGDLARELAGMKSQADRIAQLLHERCGEDSHVLRRAQQVCAAIVRLQWELERLQKGRQASAAKSGSSPA